MGGAAADRLLGIKSFTGQSRYEVNIAPYMRRSLDVRPPSLATNGIVDTTGCYAHGTILADGQNSGTLLFTAGIDTKPLYDPLSDAPLEHTIAAGERDYLSVASPNDTILFTLTYPSQAEFSKTITTPQVGTFVFAAPDNMPEGAEAELRFRYGWEQYTTVRKYRGVKRAPNSVRLCWLNAFGGFDSYTFGRAEGEQLTVEKERARTVHGTETFGATVETLIALQSDWESIETMRWLHGVIASPRVWLFENGEFRRVDVMTRNATLTNIAPARLEIVVRDLEKAKTHRL